MVAAVALLSDPELGLALNGVHVSITWIEGLSIYTHSKWQKLAARRLLFVWSFIVCLCLFVCLAGWLFAWLVLICFCFERKVA